MTIPMIVVLAVVITSVFVNMVICCHNFFRDRYGWGMMWAIHVAWWVGFAIYIIGCLAKAWQL